MALKFCSYFLVLVLLNRPFSQSLEIPDPLEFFGTHPIYQQNSRQWVYAQSQGFLKQGKIGPVIHSLSFLIRHGEESHLDSLFSILSDNHLELIALLIVGNRNLDLQRLPIAKSNLREAQLSLEFFDFINRFFHKPIQSYSRLNPFIRAFLSILRNPSTRLSDHSQNSFLDPFDIFTYLKMFQIAIGAKNDLDLSDYKDSGLAYLLKLSSGLKDSFHSTLKNWPALAFLLGKSNPDLIIASRLDQVFPTLIFSLSESSLPSWRKIDAFGRILNFQYKPYETLLSNLKLDPQTRSFLRLRSPGSIIQSPRFIRLKYKNGSFQLFGTFSQQEKKKIRSSLDKVSMILTKCRLPKKISLSFRVQSIPIQLKKSVNQVFLSYSTLYSSVEELSFYLAKSVFLNFILSRYNSDSRGSFPLWLPTSFFNIVFGKGLIANRTNSLLFPLSASSLLNLPYQNMDQELDGVFQYQSHKIGHILFSTQPFAGALQKLHFLLSQHKTSHAILDPQELQRLESLMGYR